MCMLRIKEGHKGKQEEHRTGKIQRKRLHVMTGWGTKLWKEMINKGTVSEMDASVNKSSIQVHITHSDILWVPLYL